VLATPVVCEPTTLALYTLLNILKRRRALLESEGQLYQTNPSMQFIMYQTNNSTSVIYFLNLSFFNILQNTLFYRGGQIKGNGKQQ
jgi:hypothetical protein